MAGLSPPHRVVLLTGASGFVGRQAIAPLLRRGFLVEAVSRGDAPLRVEGVTWRRADLLDVDQRRELIERTRATHLLHLAWDVDPDRFWTAPENEVWARASLDLLKRFAANGGQRALLVGSCAEYAWMRDGDAPFRESDLCRPATVYGEAKYRLANEAAEHAATVGLSLAWGRLFQMFGLYEYPKRLVPAVAMALIRGEEIACTQGRQIRDYSDTRDVAMALAAVLAATRVTGAVNIASGEGISVRDLCRLIQEEIGCPSRLLKFGALPDRQGDPASLVADVTRLRQEAGFSFSGRLEDRLADTVARYRRAVGNG